MKLLTVFFFATLCALPSRLAIAADPANATPTPSDTIAARRSLEVSGVSALHLRDMVLKAAAENAAVANVRPARVANHVEVKTGGRDALGGRRMPDATPDVVEIVVNLGGADAAAAGVKPRAVEYLDAIVASIERQLHNFHDNRTVTAKKDLKEVELRLQDTDAKTSDIEERIREITGRVDASIEPIRAAVPKLEEERQSLKLQVIGKQARQEALAEAIARHAKGAEERLNGDEVTGQLEKIAAARVTHLERIRTLHDSGQVPLSEVVEAETAIAEAKTRILERREAVKQSAGGGELLGKLNQELAMLSIDVAEAEAKLSAIEQLLKKYGDAQPLLTEAERIRRERERLDKSRDNAEAAVRDAQATVPDPVLRVLDSDATPATSPSAP